MILRYLAFVADRLLVFVLVLESIVDRPQIQIKADTSMAAAAKSSSRGLLITCDVPTKQFILHICQEKGYVLDDLDETVQVVLSLV